MVDQQPGVAVLGEQDPAAADTRILRAIRRIIRAVDLHSRKLMTGHQITTPQLVCLLAVSECEPARSSEVAKSVSLSTATVIGILDRLESKGLVRRERNTTDRRVVNLWLTPDGRRLVETAPSPLQDTLAGSIERLPTDEQFSIAAALERVVGLMEADQLDAAPLLESGPIAPSREAGTSAEPTKELSIA